MCDNVLHERVSLVGKSCVGVCERVVCVREGGERARADGSEQKNKNPTTKRWGKKSTDSRMGCKLGLI